MVRGEKVGEPSEDEDLVEAEEREAETAEDMADIERRRLKMEEEEWRRRKAKKIGRKKPWPSDTKRRSKWRYEGRGREGLEGARWIPVVLAVIVWILDFYLGFDGLRVGIQLRRLFFGGFSVLAPTFTMGFLDYLIGIFQNYIFIGAVVFLIIIYQLDRREVGSWALMIYVGMVIFFGGGWRGSGWIHLIMAGLFYFLVLSKYYEDNKPKARFILCGLLFVDFFLYGIIQDFFVTEPVIKYILSNRLIIPIWFYASVAYAYKIRSSFVTALLIFMVVMVNTFAVYGGIVDIRDFSRTIDPQQREEFKDYFTRSKDNFQNWVKELFTDIKRSAEQQLEYATGGYYVGTVEKNEEEELGVYLDNVEAADKRFLENEEVVIWGDLKARTLEDPIYVYMSCEVGGVKGEIIPETLANPEYSENYEKGHKIEQLEQIGFECRFYPGQLETGSNLIKIKAEFNFETLAFLKTYFMDIERVRALRKENIDPLLEYGIKDRSPIAVFTNGPVKLGMGTVDPPLGVNAENEVYSYVGVTVEKKWLGQIKDIKELSFQVPGVFKLEPPNSDIVCRGDFKKESENEDGYALYKMTDTGIGKIKKPITQFVSRRCSMTVPRASEVLGKTPVTTYYYRAGVKYIYEIEKSISVHIKGVPRERTKLPDCDINCTDYDGCICNKEEDDCNMPKGSEVSFGYTCDNYFGGCSNMGRSVEQDLGFIGAVEEYIEGMMELNGYCLRGEMKEINETIDSSKELTDKEKEKLKKDIVLEGCKTKSYRFFEITESLIVRNAGCGVDIFKVLLKKRNELTDEEKSKANSEKERFDELLGRVIDHFKENNEWVQTEYNEANIKKIEERREELGNINFD